MKIYIAGKITGDPDYRAKFADAQRQIEAQGHIVLNPATLPEGMEPMDTDKHISECEVKRIGLGDKIGFVGLETIGARGREYGVALNGFGKTVFLTREEAEKALAEMEGKKE